MARLGHTRARLEPIQPGSARNLQIDKCTVCPGTHVHARVSVHRADSQGAYGVVQMGGYRGGGWYLLQGTVFGLLLALTALG